jgi:hypothetical protein
LRTVGLTADALPAVPVVLQAAHALPGWLKPEASSNRVWLRQGQLHIIPPACNCTAAQLAVLSLAGLNQLRDRLLHVLRLAAFTHQALSHSLLCSCHTACLLQAAYALPRWLKPETSSNRVWLRQGQLHIIPPPPQLHCCCTACCAVPAGLWTEQTSRERVRHLPCLAAIYKPNLISQWLLIMPHCLLLSGCVCAAPLAQA